MSFTLEPGFLTGRHGHLFVLRAAPAGPPRRRLLIVPPFAEELNKSRRILALVARAAAAEGFEVVWPDLTGTGDSGGGFEDASWTVWGDDLLTAATAFETVGPIDVLALRFGALLLPALLAAKDVEIGTAVLWQPVVNGEVYLKQFLRLRSVAAKIAGREEPLKQLLETLDAGTPLEVGGYRLNPVLAAELQRARLTAAALARAGGIELLEFKRGETAEHSAPMRALLDEAATAGIAHRGTVVDAEAFWATQEIAAPPAAVSATLDRLA